MRVLITGGAGFIGSSFVSLVLQDRPDWEVTTLDLLTYAGNLRSLGSSLDDERHTFVRADIVDREGLEENLDGTWDLLVHFAAESHVDRSIVNASEFARTNVLGTQVLLDFARKRGVRRFLQVSTDEVYGSLGPEGSFSETSPIAPTSPYAASKAAADLLVMAAHRTHGQDVVITRCSNNYGPRQFPEKLIPLMILNALQDKPLPVYGDGSNIRDWIHVDDHCRAVLAVAEGGLSGSVYNVGADSEVRNLDVVREILRAVGKPQSLIRFVTDRPAHDLRYAIDASKTKKELGWAPKHDFETGLQETVDWYLANESWWREVLSGEHQEFFEKWYAGRLPDIAAPAPLPAPRSTTAPLPVQAPRTPEPRVGSPSPRSDPAPTKVRCPHLYGSKLQGDTYFAYPSSGNCCARMNPKKKGFLFWAKESAPHIETDYQKEFCLTIGHARCSLYEEPENATDPEGERNE